LNSITQGLFIFGVGMVVLTISLGLLALIIELLSKVIKEKGSGENTPGQEHAEQEAIPPSLSFETEVVAAAVGVRYLLAYSAGSPDLGKLLENPPGPYHVNHNTRDKPYLPPSKKWKTN